MAANIASQRAPWEAHIVLRDELATVMSNRAAAFLEVGDCISSLVDAEVVIQLKRNWSKGYFRKAKALLKMDRAQEARDAIQSGLAFDPDNRVCITIQKHARRSLTSICYQELQEILARIDWFLNRADEDEESSNSPTTDAQSPTPAS